MPNLPKDKDCVDPPSDSEEEKGPRDRENGKKRPEKRSYYYDDAYGYEDYDPEEDEAGNDSKETGSS